MLVIHRLGEDFANIATRRPGGDRSSPAGGPGAGQSVRDASHVIAMERKVLESFSDRAPCKSKVRERVSPAMSRRGGHLRVLAPVGPSAQGAFPATARRSIQPPRDSQPDQPLLGAVCHLCHTAPSDPRAKISSRPVCCRFSQGRRIRVLP
ncbi:hypothetical protein AQJ58_22445 [Streptomyces sp. DSM 15324]|nr:hypothetical protein AQJ58_22445 [Streptomyces sp. DSM 15324]